MATHRLALTGICLAAMAAVWAADHSAAFAQRPRTGIERRQHPGRGFWANERASRNMRHARDYSQGIYYYSQGVERIEPQVARAESEQLGRNIDTTRKELSVVRTEAEADKETLASLEAIEKHLAKAAETHKILHAEASKDSVDPAVCAECCNEITKELEMAMAEHDALRRRLELKSRSNSAQPAPGDRN